MLDILVLYISYPVIVYICLKVMFSFNFYKFFNLINLNISY